MTGRLVLTLALSVSGLLSYPGVVAAQDKTAFQEGYRARQDKKWEEAVTKMRSAIQADSRESAEKIDTQRRFGALLPGGAVEYLPHFFLGESLFNRNDCVGAVVAWEESERQGVVRLRQDFVAIIQRGYGACATRGVLPPAEFQPLVQRAEAALEEATAARTRAGERNADQNAVWRQVTALSEQFDRAVSEVDASRTRLGVGRRTRAAQDLNDARTLAERARDGFARTRVDLDAAVERFASVQGQVQGLARAIAAAEEIDRTIDPLLARAPRAALPPAAVATRLRARDSLARAREVTRGSDTASPTVLTDITRSVQDANAALVGLRDQAGRIVSTALEGDRKRLLGLADESLSFARNGMTTLDRVWQEKQVALGPDAARNRDAARRQFDNAVKSLTDSRTSGDLDRIQEATRRLASARRLIDAWVMTFSGVELTLEDRGVPPALVMASRRFMSGEYDAALVALNDSTLTRDDTPLQVHVHVFKAASLFALFVRSGEKTQELKDQALASVMACRDIDPGFQPDPRVFGPRFLEFFAGATR